MVDYFRSIFLLSTLFVLWFFKNKVYTQHKKALEDSVKDMLRVL